MLPVYLSRFLFWPDLGLAVVVVVLLLADILLQTAASAYCGRGMISV